MVIENRLIGRQKELSELNRIFESVEQGRGCVALLAGEAGIGKTILAEECLAESGFRAFNARASEDATPAYGPIATILRDCLRSEPDAGGKSNPFSKYLSLLLPELGTPPKDTDREMLVEAINSTLTEIAKAKPLAIFLDDLQWVDNATLELLPLLADRIRTESILILGTYRSDEIPRGHRMRWLRNELRRRRRLQEISLEPLSSEETADLVERVMETQANPDVVRMIYERTLGVPLFVEELSAALISNKNVVEGESGLELSTGATIPIPESVRDAILIQLDDLSGDARSQLEAAAVAGMEFDLNLLEKFAEKASALDELLDRSIIIETGNGKGTFRHALTREAIRSEIMWSKRRTLNRSIADYLESINAPPGTDCRALAGCQ